MLAEESAREVATGISQHRHREHERDPGGAAARRIDAQPDEVWKERARVDDAEHHVPQIVHRAGRVPGAEQAAHETDRHHGHQARRQAHGALRGIARRREGDQAPDTMPGAAPAAGRERHLKVLVQADRRDGDDAPAITKGSVKISQRRIGTATTAVASRARSTGPPRESGAPANGPHRSARGRSARGCARSDARAAESAMASRNSCSPKSGHSVCVSRSRYRRSATGGSC